jgi:hypothetical protein
LNGIWLVSPSEGYRDAYAVTPQVMACRSPGQENMQDLRSLPGLALLHEGLSSIDYNEEQDEFIRAEKGPYGDSRQLLLERRPALFDAATGTSTTSAPRQTWPSPASGTLCQRAGRAGVAHPRRRDRHPRPGNHPWFKTIERGFSSSPPRYFPAASFWPSPKKASRASSTPKASCWPPLISGARR